MVTQKPINILILDTETTGLNPTTDCLLEIAFIPAQLSPEQLRIESQFKFTHTISPKNPDLLLSMNSRVKDMHRVSGLLDDLKNETLTVSEVETILLLKLNSLFGVDTKNIQLCGNSIHFDRGFIKEHMPRLEERLSYRMLDMTPYRTIRNMISGQTEHNPKHRALDDCTYSAGLLSEFYEELKCKNL